MRSVNKAIDLLMSEQDDSLFSNIFEFNDEWLDKHVKGTWTRRPDGKIDIDGDISFYGMSLTKIPYQFGKVSGEFLLTQNNLTSLAGAPEEVGGDFTCSATTLRSLVGSPKKVGGDFRCSFNLLTSLKGGPEWVGGDYYCQRNRRIRSLKGAPKVVKHTFRSDQFYDEDYREYAEKTYGQPSK